MRAANNCLVITTLFGNNCLLKIKKIFCKKLESSCYQTNFLSSNSLNSKVIPYYYLKLLFKIVATKHRDLVYKVA